MVFLQLKMLIFSDKMPFKFVVLFLSLFCNTVFGQNTQAIDSLCKLYAKYENSDLKKALFYAEKAVFVDKSHINDSLSLIVYNNYVNPLYKHKKYDTANKYAISLKDLATKLNNSYFLCHAYIHLSNINRKQRQYNESLAYVEKAIKLAKKASFSQLEHRALNSKCMLLRSTKNRKGAIKNLKNIFTNKKFTDVNNLGLSYDLLGANYFKLLNKKDSAIYFYKKGIDLIKNTDNNYLKSILYSNLGNVLLQTKDKKKGIDYLLLAKKTATKCNYLSALYNVTSSLGIYYNNNKNYNKAIKYYKEAEEKYGKYTSKHAIAHLYWLLSGALYFEGHYKEGFEYQDKLILLKDSLFTVEKNKTFEKLQTEYEVEKKNNQIQLLEKEQELAANRKKLFFGIGGLIVFILGLLVFVYRYKVKSQKLIRKQEQKLHLQEKEQLEHTQRLKHIEGFIQGEEKEKNRIAVELHDGIGGKLAGIKHLVSALQKTENTAVLTHEITAITKEVRLLSHSLSYTYSLQKPLQQLLEELKEQYKNHFSVEVILYPENKINALADAKKLFIYRSIQELVNNCYKYAKANTVSISLTYDEELLLLVEDDGVGFTSNKTFNGIGLQNIKEKLVKFKGELHIDTAIKRGTTIIIKIPAL